MPLRHSKGSCEKVFETYISEDYTLKIYKELQVNIQLKWFKIEQALIKRLYVNGKQAY